MIARAPVSGWPARCMLACAGLALSAAAAVAEPPQPAMEVVPGHALEFPSDYGSHPQFGVEWWYVTGWLTTGRQQRLGFQITFFRARQSVAEANPSAFAPSQLLIAHCAISDPVHTHLWHDQRIRRAGLGLAEARTGDTSVWIDDWHLERRDSTYQVKVAAEDFALNLSLAVAQPVLLNGLAGYSRKGPSPQSASYYYSQPHLRVSGSVERAGRADRVSGEAWLDHEWSSQYLDSAADGWDWIGLNLDDGGAAMAFRIRDHQGHAYWAGGTLRDAGGEVHAFAPDDVTFTPVRSWRSPRTGITYPVSWRVRLGTRQFAIEPLLDDQENDARFSSGAVYWEGAVGALESSHDVGRGYLELTGYDRPLSLR